MKLGVICDGISRDLEHTVSVMNEFDLTYAELQFVWDHEVGDHSAKRSKRLIKFVGTTASLSVVYRAIFCGDEHRKSPR